METGKLLFKLETLEDKGMNKTKNNLLLLVFGVLCIAVFSCFMKYVVDNFNPYDPDAKQYFTIFLVLFISIISITLVCIFEAKKKAEKAQLFIFENCVIGTAGEHFWAPFENFNIAISDIINISSTDQFVIIYTQWKSYKVRSFGKQAEIIKIINSQIESRKTAEC